MSGKKYKLIQTLIITEYKEYIKQAKPDILLIQEIKTEDKNFPYEEFEKNGYYSYV